MKYRFLAYSTNICLLNITYYDYGSYGIGLVVESLINADTIGYVVDKLRVDIKMILKSNMNEFLVEK